MQPTARDSTYYGQIYIPQHAVAQARERFPLFCNGKTDADLRRHIDEAAMQLRNEWRDSRRPGEFVVPVPTADEGPMYPILVRSNRSNFEWAIVSVMTESMVNSWSEYPPEMPHPKIVLKYRLKSGAEQFKLLDHEDDVAEQILKALESGAQRSSIEMYRQIPYALIAQTKR